jgi:hypothetical protein
MRRAGEDLFAYLPRRRRCAPPLAGVAGRVSVALATADPEARRTAGQVDERTQARKTGQRSLRKVDLRSRPSSHLGRFRFFRGLVERFGVLLGSQAQAQAPLRIPPCEAGTLSRSRRVGLSTRPAHDRGNAPAGMDKKCAQRTMCGP